MKDLKLFATEACPLHPSGLRALLTCPWRAAVHYLYEPSDEGGEAGDTGSATHAAVAAFHRGSERAACLEEMRRRANEYPRADLQDAAHLFLKYANDARNCVECVLIEAHIAFSISPAPEDPTQAPIQVIGRVDQVRADYSVWDLKTSKKDGPTLLNQSLFQAAAYCVGASVKLGREVKPGGLILPRRYNADGTGPAFWHFPWVFADIPQILEGVRHTVAAIRSGHIWHVPNQDCFWCPMRSPDVCLPELQKTLRLL